ncbi:MAG: hypothetical protein ACEQSB_06450 [Undibacterium sp.]
MKDPIQLTFCIQFQSEEERDLVQEYDKQRRKEKAPALAQELVNAILLSRKKAMPVIGEIGIGGKKFIVSITEET